MRGSSSPGVSYDVREPANRFYRSRILPLRVTLVALATGLAGAVIALVFWKGVGAVTLVLGGGVTGFAAFVWWALGSLFTHGPTAVRVSPDQAELVYPGGQVEPIPYRKPGTRIELTDLASTKVLGRPAAWGGVPWLLEVNGGPPIALSSEALAALREFLTSHGLRLDYAGTYHGLRDSRAWRFVA